MIRQEHHVSDIASKYPGAWRTFDDFISQKGKDLPSWPPWCYCPMAAAYAIVTQRPGLDPSDIGRLSALAAWRAAKTIYRFDETLVNALITTELTGNLPTELFFHLPEWCVYIEIPKGVKIEYAGCPVTGYYAHLEWDVEAHRTELRFVLDSASTLIPVPLHLENTIEESVRRAVDEAARQSGLAGVRNFQADVSRMAVEVSPFVSMLLYLCTENRDITGTSGQPKSMAPNYPRPKHTKRRDRIFAAERAEYWQVGFKVGAAIRASSVERGGTHSSPRPHIRRAHWHTFLTGTRANPTPLLKWLPPMPVNVDVGEIKPTIRSVRT